MKYVVTDEQDRTFQDRAWELENRWRKNSLDPDRTLDGLQMLIENKGVSDYKRIIRDWQQFYLDLGIMYDLSGVRIPDDPGGFKRVIIMTQGVTPQSAYDLCARNFPCWKHTDDNLDEIVTSDRTAKCGSYAIRVRDRVEADEELANRSYNDLKRDGVVGITLEEREIYELKFFKETDKHLDINNWTLCAGSLCSDGGVPNASWSGCELKVDWDGRGDAGGGLRSRAAVS
ncbi:hypothetical protein A3J77_00660 [Candidatus Wolfebacteria bacterium RBG_13_41_7]|uniref:Uncharacterized protein n=1 Tax=Candidatus Wolfebacteria bacterium RBG_13_41_7 TaxID=1802554 RepID=A0A1F8DMW2_9BACT|nr:MAG: hypothetical protein A3J77_00660 [Candidatus Wolfebacteria bacterium RBG_13_41_7]